MNQTYQRAQIAQITHYSPYFILDMWSQVYQSCIVTVVFRWGGQRAVRCIILVRWAVSIANNSGGQHRHSTKVIHSTRVTAGAGVLYARCRPRQNTGRRLNQNVLAGSMSDAWRGHCSRNARHRCRRTKGTRSTPHSFDCHCGIARWHMIDLLQLVTEQIANVFYCRSLHKDVLTTAVFTFPRFFGLG